jgi:hypothetical protein
LLSWCLLPGLAACDLRGWALRVIAVGVWIVSSTHWSWRPGICAREGIFPDIGHDVDSDRLW